MKSDSQKVNWQQCRHTLFVSTKRQIGGKRWSPWLVSAAVDVLSNVWLLAAIFSIEIKKQKDCKYYKCDWIMSLLLLLVYLQTSRDSIIFFPCFTITGSEVMLYVVVSCFCEAVFRKSDVTHDDEITAGLGVAMLEGSQWSGVKKTESGLFEWTVTKLNHL